MEAPFAVYPSRPQGAKECGGRLSYQILVSTEKYCECMCSQQRRQADSSLKLIVSIGASVSPVRLHTKKPDMVDDFVTFL
jgi:hypothetical protein